LHYYGASLFQLTLIVRSTRKRKISTGRDSPCSGRFFY
jgi:hypothetical protein